jgi:hypothetical protein
MINVPITQSHREDFLRDKVLELEEKLRHAMWAIKSIERLEISQTQRAIIEVALTKINAR